MFISYIRHSYLVCLLFIFTTASIADVYKWVDTNGETHYSQQPPRGEKVEIIKAPPPPAIDPNVAQQKTDALIEQQTADREAQIDQRKQLKSKSEQAGLKKDICQKMKHNLQQHQDNPGRNAIDAKGNVTRLSEQDRQAKIKQLQNNINTHCL